MSSLAKHQGKYHSVLVVCALLLLFPLHLFLFLAPFSSYSTFVLHCCVHQRVSLTPSYVVQALISVCSDWLHVSSQVHSELR